MSTGPLATAATAGSPAANAWITNGTRRRTQRTSESGSRPCSWAPERPSVFTVSTTRSGTSSRNTPTVTTPGGRRLTMLGHRSGGHDLARAAGREVETERVGAERDGEQRVLLVRDPADLHPHRCGGYRNPFGARRTFVPHGHHGGAGPHLVARRPRLAPGARDRGRVRRPARAGRHPGARRARRPAARLRQMGVRRPRADGPAAARALGPGQSALVRLRRMAHVPEPLRGDAHRSRSCSGSSTTRDSDASAC